MVRELSVEIDAAPGKVYEFLSDYAGHFREVSPDHIERGVVVKDIRIKDGYIDNPRVFFYFKQVSPVTGRVQKVRGRLLRLEPGSYIKYRFLFPVSLVLPLVENTLEPKGNRTVFKTSLHFSRPASWLAERSPWVRGKLEAVIAHIQEEMDTTKAVLEGGTQPVESAG